MPKIELAQPALRMLVCAISFDASPLFPDVRGAITRDLLETLQTKKWQFDGRELSVVNDSTKRFVAMEPEGVMFVAENPPADGEALSHEWLSVAHVALSHLEVGQISSFAMNLDWQLAVQKGTDLQVWLHDYLGLKAANSFFDAFGGKPSETETKFRFMPQKDVLASAELKVLDAEEALDEAFFDATESEFANETLALSLWRIEEPDDAFSSDTLKERWLDSYARMLRMSERAGTALTGRG